VSSEEVIIESHLSKSLHDDRTFFRFILVAIVILALTLIFHDVPIASIVSLVLFALTLFLLFYRNPAFFLTYFYYYFASVANLVGVLVCEFCGISLGELGNLQSYFVGSLPAIAFAWWLFFIILERTSHGRLRNQPKHFSNDSENEGKESSGVRHGKGILCSLTIWWLETGIRWAELAIPLFYLAVYLVVFLYVLPYPAFLLNVDRFQYEDIRPLGIGTSVMNIASYCLPLLLFQSYRGERRGLCLTGIVISLAVYLWTGNKFGVFLNLIIDICLVASIVSKEQLDPKRLRNTVLGVLGALALASITAVVIQTVFLNPSSKSTDYFEDRVSQQGQLWWNIFRKQENEAPHVDELSHEVEVWFSNKSDDELSYDYGIYKMMKLSAPSDIIDKKIESGSRYTEAGFASAYYYGGYFGIAIFAIVMALLSSLCVRLLLSSVKEYRVVEAIILCRFYSILRTSLSMFTFNALFSLKSFISLAVLLLVLLCWKRAGMEHVEVQT
jgi:hypothetical protein